MGLFNWKKTKQEEPQAPQKKMEGSFINFILLNEEQCDFHKLVGQMKEDWNIELNESEIDFEGCTIASEVEGMMIAITLIGAPVPHDEVVANARTNYAWQDAVSVAEAHKAHVLLAVLPREQSNMEAGVLAVKLTSSIVKAAEATGINTLGSVLHPGAYRDMAELAIKEGAFPIMNLIFAGIYSNDGGKTVSGYTFGMESFGKDDIEVLNSSHSREEVYYFLYDIADYVISSDVTLKHGETIGFSAEQKLSIALSDGVALAGKTLKIGY